jgi:hypothetical protein
LLVEELEAAEGDGVGAAGDFLDGAQVEEGVADLLFPELVWGGMIEPGQLGRSSPEFCVEAEEAPRLHHHAA